jgi:site-specific DNA-methyltransferase (adenine-specific)
MRNEIILGDCLEKMKDIPCGCVDMILCDLPYGTTQSDWDIIIPFEPLWIEYERVIKDNGAIVLFGAEPFSSYLRLSNIKLYKYDWIWDKIKGTGFLNAKKQPLRVHETISVFYKNQCNYNPQKTTGHNNKKSFRGKHLQTEVYGELTRNYLYESTERYPTSIQVFSTDTQNSSLHPNQKPVSLLRYLIRTYTNEGDLILDNSAGSGSTGIACIEENRNFILIEKHKHYYEITLSRISEHTAQLKLL